MKISVQTYTAMKHATQAFLVDTLGLDAELCGTLVTAADINACTLAVEEPDGINPHTTGDYSNAAERFIGSLEGCVEYHLGKRGNLSADEVTEVARAAEACADAVLSVSTPPKPRKAFYVVVPAEIAEPTYIDCHDGGGYVFDETATNAALEALGLVEDPLFNFSGVEGDYDTVCGYDNLLHVRFKRHDHAVAFANQLGLS